MEMRASYKKGHTRWFRKHHFTGWYDFNLSVMNNKHGVNLKCLQHSNPKTPRIYGLPKIHKPGNKLRPIISNIDAPTEHFSKWLTNKLKDFPDPPGLFVKNTQEFVEKVTFNSLGTKC
jgi:hypothetical protein